MNRTLPALLVTAVLLGGCTASPAPTSGASQPAGATSAVGTVQSENLDAPAFAKLTQTPGVRVIDVRTPAEYGSGHLENAVNIDLQSPDFATKIAELPQDGTYALYCRSGNRSAQALQAMKAAGFTRVAHLQGGIGAWQAAGYPVA